MGEFSQRFKAESLSSRRRRNLREAMEKQQDPAEPPADGTFVKPWRNSRTQQNHQQPLPTSCVDSACDSTQTRTRPN
ncbi:hypothetical protein QE152_g36524 [Popillia japonica]|uniref:Uncharacterized protein n=1 Tax=Popillia japonica TaxID=7064 RepID=A0AAW1ID86_POPJA